MAELDNVKLHQITSRKEKLDGQTPPIKFREAEQNNVRLHPFHPEVELLEVKIHPLF